MSFDRLRIELASRETGFLCSAPSYERKCTITNQSCLFIFHRFIHKDVLDGVVVACTSLPQLSGGAYGWLT